MNRIALFLFFIAALAGMHVATHEAGFLVSEAQEGFAEYVVIADEDVIAGDIITLKDNYYRKSSTPYDSKLAGVITAQPAVAFGVSGRGNTHPLATAGTFYVNISGAGGAIEAGDFITSSEQPGIGKKATRPGFVIGTAREEFNPAGPTDIGQIPVTINIHFASVDFDDEVATRQSLATQLRHVLTMGAIAAATEPNTFLRYTAAALIGLASIVLGFLSSARAAGNGVTAIGRNPMAKKSIIMGIFINVFITIAIAGAGLALAAFILAW